MFGNLNNPTALYNDQPDSIRIEVISGPEAGRIISPKMLPVKIGRGRSCGIVLIDNNDPPAVSREHLTLEIIKEILVVRDHSTNGTKVGDRWLQFGEAAEWPENELVQIGPTVRIKRMAGNMAIAGDMEHRVTSAPKQPSQPRSLRNYITSTETLAQAWRRVELNRGAAGPDNISIAEFAEDAPRRLGVLSKELSKGHYEPLPPRLFAAPKRNGGVRRISILSLTDRIVQQAIHMAVSPILEQGFPDCNYAYRPGRSAHDAMRKIDTLLKSGMHWIAETDIEGFFDRISHKILLDKVAEAVSDPFVLSIISRCLSSGAYEKGIGIAQGAPLSPLLSNLYLADFDTHMLEGGWNPVRYGDDIVFIGTTRMQSQTALAEAQGYLRSNLKLDLKADKTSISNLSKGFVFLGYRFTDNGRNPSPHSIARLHERLEEASPASAPAIIRGWGNYYKENTLFSDPANDLDESLTSQFIGLFGGREDIHATMGKNGLVPCMGSITAKVLRNHLSGSETVAAYLQRLDGLISAVVMDIDIKKKDKVDDREALSYAHSSSCEIIRVCQSFGIPASMEDSGRRGRHIWIFFSEPILPEKGRRLARLISLRAGFPRKGVRLEIFPRHSEWPGPELGDAVKLPYGIHPASGRRCQFLDKEGDPITDVAKAMKSLRPLDTANLDQIIRSLNKSEPVSETEYVQNQDRVSDGTPTQAKMPPTHSAVDQLLSSCSVLRTLVEQARTIGHLRHTHNLILLYTLGRLGDEGAAFIHKTLANCRNYDERVCQGYIDRLEQQKPPITCRRIREWLEEEGEAEICTCMQNCHTPLSKLNAIPTINIDNKPRKRKIAVPYNPLPSETDDRLRNVWVDVSEDLFTETDIDTDVVECETDDDSSSSEDIKC